MQRACGMAGITWQCGWTGGLAWPPDAFTFQWVLAVVQVSNWFSSESLRAAKVLEESQPGMGASSASECSLQKHVIMYCVVPTDCGSMGISKAHLLLSDKITCDVTAPLAPTPASTGVLLYSFHFVGLHSILAKELPWVPGGLKYLIRNSCVGRNNIFSSG